MKTKLLLIIGIATVATSGFAQATNAGVQLTADQIAKLNNSIDSIVPLLPAQYQGLVAKLIALIALLAMAGRVVTGWRTSGLFGALAGLFKGTNAPNDTTSPSAAAKAMADRQPSPPPGGGEGAVRAQSPKGASLGVLLAAVLGLTAFSQTRLQAETNQIGNLLPLPTNNATQLLRDVEQLGGDAWAALGTLDFNEGVSAAPFGVYIANGDFGGGIAVEAVGTNSMVHLGFFTAVMYEKQLNADGTTTKTVNWYDGGLTVSIGGTTSVPILGTVYAEAIAGPVMNFSTRTLYQEEFANFSKSWDLGSGWTLAVFGGTGYFSKYQDQAAFDGGLNVTKRF